MDVVNNQYSEAQGLLFFAQVINKLLNFWKLNNGIQPLFTVQTLSMDTFDKQFSEAEGLRFFLI